MVSKLLLETVLGYNIKDKFTTYEKEVTFRPTNRDNIGVNCKWDRWDESEAFNYISYSDLFFKCKEYVVHKTNCTLQSYVNSRGVGVCRVKLGDSQEITKILGTSEIDAVFKATEYVFGNVTKC